MAKIPAEMFKNAIPDQELMLLKIIYGAITAGVSAFLAIVIFMHFTAGTAAAVKPELAWNITVLSIVHGILLSVIYPLSGILYGRKISAVMAETDASAADGYQEPAAVVSRIMPVLRTAGIIRLAMLEGVAFFGLVTCFLAVRDGIMAAFPAYWGNLLSCALFMITVIRTFPSKEGITALYEKAAPLR